MTTIRNIYRIWPRSFKDGNGDGIGDLWGVMEKIKENYFEDLGIDAILFSPIFPSPNADYGYDISDYYNVNPEFGTINLFCKIVDELHNQGIRVILDIAFNHTSSEHPWFKMSKSRSSCYHSWYYWTTRPNNWDSLFGNKAWTYDEQANAYYLHIFTPEQPDLNHSNPAVRKEICNVLRFWKLKGVDGFRLDMILALAKDPGFPNDKALMLKGMKYYINQPELKTYLKEFREAVGPEALLIGEGDATPGETAELTNGPRPLLDYLYTSEHLRADRFLIDYIPRPFSLPKIKKILDDRQEILENGDLLYLENHDHQRIVSHYGDEKKYWEESAKMLATMYLLMRGPAVVYQGQEIGMLDDREAMPKNPKKNPDVITRYVYKVAKKIIGPHLAAWWSNKVSRQHVRVPISWTYEHNCAYSGFSTVKPWFPSSLNDTRGCDISVVAQKGIEGSIWEYYKELLEYRRNSKVVQEGYFEDLCPNDRNVFAYMRHLDSENKILVICSFSRKPHQLKIDFDLSGSRLRFSNYFGYIKNDILYPFEARVYEWRPSCQIDLTDF